MTLKEMIRKMLCVWAVTIFSVAAASAQNLICMYRYENSCEVVTNTFPPNNTPNDIDLYISTHVTPDDYATVQYYKQLSLSYYNLSYTDQDLHLATDRGSYTFKRYYVYDFYTLTPRVKITYYEFVTVRRCNPEEEFTVYIEETDGIHDNYIPSAQEIGNSEADLPAPPGTVQALGRLGIQVVTSCVDGQYDDDLINVHTTDTRVMEDDVNLLHYLRTITITDKGLQQSKSVYQDIYLRRANEYNLWRTEYSCETSPTVFGPVNSQGDIEAYLLPLIPVHVREQIESLKNYHGHSGYSVGYNDINYYISQNRCYYSFTRQYVYYFFGNSPETIMTFREFIKVYRNDPPDYPFEVSLLYTDGEHDDYLPSQEVKGCSVLDLPLEPTTIEELNALGIYVSQACSDNIVDIWVADEMVEDPDPCHKKFLRSIHISAPCANDEKVVYQEFNMKKDIWFYGVATPIYYSGANRPRPITSPYQFERETGVNIITDCGKDFELTAEDTQRDDIPNRFFRKYYVKYKDCYDRTIMDSVTQELIRRDNPPVPFVVNSYEEYNGTSFNAHIEVDNPSTEEGGPGCDDDHWYLTVLKKIQGVEEESEEQYCYENPIRYENLQGGRYDLKIYANCTNCGLEGMGEKPIFSQMVNTKYMLNNVHIVTANSLTAGSNYFLLLWGSHCSYYPPTVEGEKYGPFAWELTTMNNVYSPGYPYRYTWDHVGGRWCISAAHVIGYGPSTGGQWSVDERYDMYRTKHPELKMALNMVSVTFTAKLSGSEDIYKQAYKYIYRGQFCESDDPNEIYGPQGYGDSLFVSGQDRFNYRVTFENDSLSATNSAARVKVTIPIDEHFDLSTVRLERFGYGDFSFDVPTMSSYYNQRIAQDSLGYWLDVIGNLDVENRELYWIFQTIDPATGVAPSDSLGFLPINDTLGSGEGFVEFSMVPIVNTRATGDSIAERAQIIFDENEMIPTNEWVNYLDNIAPVSSFRVDTIGVYNSKVITFYLEGHDEEHGSGLRMVKLFANIDNTNYELVADAYNGDTIRFNVGEGVRYDFVTTAIDNVGNTETMASSPQFTYTNPIAPQNLLLSNTDFMQNDSIGTYIGTLTTIDRQTSNKFEYTLVPGENATDNQWFSIVEDKLYTAYDFRQQCSNLNFSIRISTRNLAGKSLEKVFVLHAEQTEFTPVTQLYAYLCPDETVNFGGRELSAEGLYFDTLQTVFHCDSVVCLRVIHNPDPLEMTVQGEYCQGYDFEDAEHGISFTAAQMDSITACWTQQADTVFVIDCYRRNATNCFDHTELSLNVHPSYDIEKDLVLCVPGDIPYQVGNTLFYADTEDGTYHIDLQTVHGCDSLLTLNITMSHETGTHNKDLAMGWNWYSSYIDLSNDHSMEDLTSSLDEEGMLIKSKTAFSMNDSEFGWSGNLNNLDNRQMYMIQTSTTAEAQMVGCIADPSVYPITLHKGWNWIGYILKDGRPTENFSDWMEIEPKNGDILKSYDNSFMMYYDGIWYGLMYDLFPGQGYMYLSNNNDNVALTYSYAENNNRGQKGEKLVSLATNWQNPNHKYANNITFVADIALNSTAIASDNFEVGAFCNGEMRGTGRVVYVPSLNVYRLFMMVYGNLGDVMDFQLYDHERGKVVKADCHQQVTFVADDSYGNMSDTYRFDFEYLADYTYKVDLCEGETYDENGFTANETGNYYQLYTDGQGNDSIVKLQLRIHQPTTQIIDTVPQFMPFYYAGEKIDGEGLYPFHLFSEHGCDSIVILNVKPVNMGRNLTVAPNPVHEFETSLVFYEFTPEEKLGLIVDIYNAIGMHVTRFEPKRYPIELPPLGSSGTYTMRIITGTGEMLTEKIIVYN